MGLSGDRTRARGAKAIWASIVICGRRRARSSQMPWLGPFPRLHATIWLVRTIRVTRYVTPLREGGSLPAIVEADDDGMYVLKFRGAGQGARALIAELVAGGIPRAAGLLVPELVFVNLDPEIAKTEPDPEIQDLIKASGGVDLGVGFFSTVGVV